DAEVDLRDYSGQRIYLAFNAYSDGSVVKDGWYIDDVALADVSETGKVSKGKNAKGHSANKGNGKANAKGAVNRGIGLGLVKDKDKESVKNPIDPAKIHPIIPAKEE